MQTETMQTDTGTKRRATRRQLVACLLVCIAAAATSALLMFPKAKAPRRSDTDVPLGVEQAVVVRYAGPRLQARPYRPGASVNLRIAEERRKGDLCIYDIRYIVSLPGTFDLTEYLTSVDGSPIDDLPAFEVHGLTSLTRDIETRIQEIETVGIHIWHWYYESLFALGVFWIAWLAGLVFVGRSRRPPEAAPLPPPPSIEKQIEHLIATLTERDLSTEEKARLETLLLTRWRDALGLTHRRMAESCRDIAASAQVGPLYEQLQSWLHNPRTAVAAGDFADSYKSRQTASSVA